MKSSASSVISCKHSIKTGFVCRAYLLTLLLFLSLEYGVPPVIIPLLMQYCKLLLHGIYCASKTSYRLWLALPTANNLLFFT